MSGEAGIGKTTIVGTLATEAANSGSLVLTGACYDLVATPAYGPWIELLRAYQPAGDLPPAPTTVLDDAGRGPPRSQDELFAQIMAFFDAVSARRPLVLILEDLHWSDASSLDLLRLLARRLHKCHLLVIATYREDDLTRDHPLYRLLPHLVRETQAERVALHRLDRPALGELVQAYYGLSTDDRQRLVAYVDQLAEGNPFFIHEILRTLQDDGRLLRTDEGWQLGILDDVQVPRLVQQVIDGRLARLSDESRRLLEIAAIIGQDVPVGIWQQVSGAPDEAISSIVEQAIERQWLVEARGKSSLQFSHALVREALYAGVTLPVRQRLHRQIAEILASAAAPRADLIAYHFKQADDPRAIDWLIRTGERGWQLYAPQTVIEHITDAIDIADEHAVQPSPSAYRLRALAYATTGEFDRARRDHEIVLTRARTAGRREIEWQALIDLGMLWAERDYDRTGRYFQQALDLAREAGDRSMLAHSLNRIGNWRLNIEQPVEAIEYHREALEIFEGQSDREGIATTLDLLGMASYLSGDLIEGTAYYRRAVDLFQELDDRRGSTSSLATLTMRGPTLQTDTMVAASSTLDECIRDGESALALAREIGWRAGETYALWMLGFCRGAQGSYDAAFDAAGRSLEIAETINHRQWQISAHCVLGMLYLSLLHPAEARDHVERGLTLAHNIGSQHWIRAASGLLASACVQQRDHTSAETMLDAVLAPDTPAQSLAQRLSWCARVELAIAQGKPGGALEIIDRLTASSPHARDPDDVLRFAILRGSALEKMDRYEDAARSLDAARTLATVQGTRPALWRIHLALGRLHRSMGNDERAANLLDTAHEMIRELAESVPDEDVGRRFVERAIQHMPQEMPLTPLQTAKLVYGGLTARQREVAALIAHGRSNREIADRLSISERTVESHVTAILSTLDFTTRSQVAAWATANGLIDHYG